MATAVPIAPGIAPKLQVTFMAPDDANLTVKMSAGTILQWESVVDLTRVTQDELRALWTVATEARAAYSTDYEHTVTPLENIDAGTVEAAARDVFERCVSSVISCVDQLNIQSSSRDPGDSQIDAWRAILKEQRAAAFNELFADVTSPSAESPPIPPSVGRVPSGVFELVERGVFIAPKPLDVQLKVVEPGFLQVDISCGAFLSKVWSIDLTTMTVSQLKELLKSVEIAYNFYSNSRRTHVTSSLRTRLNTAPFTEGGQSVDSSRLVQSSEQWAKSPFEVVCNTIKMPATASATMPSSSIDPHFDQKRRLVQAASAWVNLAAESQASGSQPSTIMPLHSILHEGDFQLIPRERLNLAPHFNVAMSVDDDLTLHLSIQKIGDVDIHLSLDLKQMTLDDVRQIIDSITNAISRYDQLFSAQVNPILRGLFAVPLVWSEKSEVPVDLNAIKSQLEMITQTAKELARSIFDEATIMVCAAHEEIHGRVAGVTPAAGASHEEKVKLVQAAIAMFGYNQEVAMLTRLQEDAS